MQRRLSTPLLLSVLLSGLFVAAGALAARKNVTSFALAFTPQQSVAAAQAAISTSMRERPVAVRLADGRPGDRPEVIGSRTDDDDNLHTLTATNEVVPFVDTIVKQQLARWGISIKDDADRVLEGKLMTYEIIETNQAVGATFNANVQLSFELKDRGGKVLWTGNAVGDATRYGKKFSNENCNEVLSDALLEAAAALVSDPGLQQAW